MEYLLPISLLGGIFALVGFVFHNNKTNDNKVSRVYGRFDEYKKDFEDKYQRKDICAILHKQICDDLVEIKKDLKTLLVKNGINKK
jgi:hypothetical protein